MSTIIFFNDLLQDHLAEVDTSGKIIRAEGYGRRFVQLLVEKLEKQKGTIFIAEGEKKESVGMASAYTIPQTSDDLLWSIPQKQGKITGVFVKEVYRGQSIGKQLIAQAENYLRELGCERITIMASAENKDGLRFYEKLGYKPSSIEIYKQIK